MTNVNDAELLEELVPTGEQLLDRHLSTAKEWFPHEFVPWSRGRDFVPGEALPTAVADLSQAVPSLDRQVQSPCRDPRRLERPGQRAGVDGDDGLVPDPLPETRGLPPAFVRKVDADGPGESVLGGQTRGAVAYEIEPRAHKIRAAVDRPPLH